MTDGERESSGRDTVREALEALGPGYELVRELGRGATAIVYLVRDHELERDLAVKVIRSSFGADEEAMARLDREARLVARLQHPNIVKLYGTRHLDDGSMVLLMEHVPGRNLKEMLHETGALPPRRAMSLLKDVTSALAYAHRRKIVHRDVKPENIYIDDEVGTARLADFGVARPWDLDTRLTLPGESLGTPAYMAPEQIDGKEVDGRSDVFSLGLVAYEMLSGGHPWEGESIYSIIFKQKQEDPPPLRALRPDLSDRVVDIVDRAIEKDPADRWASAEELLEALEALDEPDVDPLLHGLGFDEESGGEEPAAGVARTGGAAGSSAATSGRVARRSPSDRASGSAARGDEGGRRAGGSPSRGSEDRDGRGWGRALLLAGAAAILVASAWQPLGLGRLLAGNDEPEGVVETATDAPVVATPPEPPPTDSVPVAGSPRLLAGRGGNAQSGPVNSMLPEPLRVQVLDSSGVPVPEVEVAFDVVGEGGAAEPARVITGPEGEAETRLTLPATPQEVEVRAAVVGREGIETTFLVSAVPAVGAAVSAIAGDEQTAGPGEALPEALLVRVVDGDGAPVSGAEVEFVTESGTVRPLRDLTDSAGWAVARWVLADTAGPQELVARVSGSGVRVVFNANAVDPETAEAETDPGPEERSGPTVVRRGWDVGGTMVCVIGAGGRPFCRGGTTASAEVGGIVAIASGVTHACGLDEGGSAWCWGSNDGGQLGDGSRTSHAGRPVETPVLFGRITAGLSHSCALDGEGRAHCWGTNLTGQLGTGGRDDRPVPVAVATPLRFQRLVAGWNHTCGLTSSGRVYCWGLNSDGQVGDGARIDALEPVAVATGAGFQALAAGSAHTCGLRDGQVFCWGDNRHGQLGNGTAEGSLLPTPVAGLPPVVTVVAGAAHSCARTAEGEAWCWGQNIHGQLGDGTNESRRVPTRVTGDLRFTSVLAGGGVTCGRSSEGQVWCWGFNQNGQLGDGSRTSRSSPTRVGG